MAYFESGNDLYFSGSLPASGTTSAEFVRGSDWGGGVGGLLYSLRPELGVDAPRYTHYDGRGDVVLQTGSGGQSIFEAAYEAFGTRTRESGSTPDRQRANTKEEETTFQLLNEGHRYRDLETGVWLTRDPAGFVDGPNLYAYVRQNPWTMFDPEGLTGWQLHYPGAPQHLQLTNPEVRRGFQRGAGLPVVAAGVFLFHLIPGVGEAADLAEAEAAPEGSAERARANASAQLGMLTFGLWPNRSGTRATLRVIADSLEADAIRGTKRAGEVTAESSSQIAKNAEDGAHVTHPLDPNANPHADVTSKTYSGGYAPDDVVVDHVKNRAAGGHPTATSNLDLKTRESNARKGGFEGNLAKDRQSMIDAGMKRADVDKVLAPERKWIENDVHAVPVDPAKLKHLPDQQR